MEATPQSEIRDLLVREQRWLQRLAAGLLGHSAEAEDLAQDLQVLLLQRQPRLHRPRAWLRGAAQRLAMATRRQQAERRSHEQAASRPEASGGADNRLQLHRRLLEAVAGLAEPYRSTVTQCYLEGRRPKDLALDSGRSPELVRQHLSRALQMLRERLDTNFGDRQRWQRALAPIAALGRPQAGLGLLGLGSAWMLSKKLAWTAAGLLSLGGLWYFGMATPGAARSADLARGQNPPQHSEPSSPRPDAVPAQRARMDRAPDSPRRAARFLVTAPGGQAVDQGRIYLWSAGESFREAPLDAAGQADFEAVPVRGGYLVCCEGFEPVLARDTALVGSHRILVGQGRALRGFVSVDGAPPQPGELRMSLRSAGWDPESIPAALRSHFSPSPEGQPVSSVRVGADGSFEFRGLPPDWRGRIEWPRHFLLRRSDRGLPSSPTIQGLSLPEIPGDLRIELVRLPAVRGRILWADNREPVAEAEATSYLSMNRGCQPPSWVCRIRDGRFHISAQPQDDELQLYMAAEGRPALTRIRIQVRVQEYGLRHGFDLGADQISRSPQLELLLPRPDLLHRQVRVVDRSGRPVPAAVLRARIPTAPTDAAGRTQLRISREGGRGLLLYAPGHQISALDLGAAELREDPLELVLDQASGFELLIQAAAGGIPAGLQLQVSIPYSSRLADFDSHYYLAFFALNDLPLDSGMTRNSRTKLASARFRLGTKPKVNLHSVPIGETWTLRLCDQLGMVIASHRLTSDRERGIQRVEVRLPRLRGIDIRVEDPNGTAVPGARLQFPVGRRTHYVSTDAQGRAQIAPVVARPLDLAIDIDPPRGFARRAAARIRGNTAVIVLQRATPFTLHLLDDTGRPLPGVPTSVRFGEVRSRSRIPSRLDGSLRITQAPRGPVEIRTRIGGDEFRHRFDNQGQDQRITLPRSGTLSIRGRAPRGFEQAFAQVQIQVLGKRRKSWRNESLQVRLKRSEGEYQSRPTRLLPGRYRARFVRDAERLDLGIIQVTAGQDRELKLPW